MSHLKKSKNKSLEDTIAKVINYNLCTGCGTCAAICAQEAISLVVDEKKGVYIPVIEEEKCNQCGICLKICPGLEIDFKTLNQVIFGKESADFYLGNVVNSYSGYAFNDDLRYSAASGGIVTALLTFALKERIIDGALITKTNDKEPLRPYSFLARTEEEVFAARTSRYCPVPLNLSLKELLARDGIYAVVGLPCHIAGIRKAELINKKLKEKIKLHFCLVCNHTPTFRATQYLIKKLNKTGKKIKKIYYRGKGWPGGMTVRYQDGTENFINHLNFNYWGFVFQKFFWSRRCFLCNDKIGELGDISFMDPYLPEFKNEKIGASLFVTRNKLADELVEKATVAGVILSTLIAADKIKISQGLSEVKRKSAARRKLFLIGKQIVPSYSGRPQVKVPFCNLVWAAFDYLLIWLGNRSNKFVEFFCYVWKVAGKIKRKLMKKI